MILKNLFNKHICLFQDIDGTKPNPKYIKVRKDNIYTEIDGSKCKKTFIPRDHIDILDVKDINL